MQLLFISTTLKLHSEPFSNSFSDGVKEYSLSENEVKEYLVNQPDLHIKGVAYRLLNSEYYIWIRSQLCKVVELYQAGKLTTEQIQETRNNWKIVHQYAVENLDSKLVKQTLEDIAIKVDSTGYNYQTPAYDQKKEISAVYQSANAKQNQEWQRSDRLCESCQPILNFLSVRQLGNSIHYNCFICNDFCSSEPVESEIEKASKPIDKFADTKSYCQIEFKGDKKIVTYGHQIPNERSESLLPGKSSFSRIPNEAHSADSPEGRQRKLSDVSKLEWIEILSILEQCQNDTELRKDNFSLYLQVTALAAYRHSADSSKPNIGSSIGLLQFLDSCREVIKKLVAEGYYSFQSTEESKQEVTTLVSTA